MRHLPLLGLVGLAAALAACGGSTQRAAVSAAPPAANGASLLDAAPAEKEYVVDVARSKLEVWSQDIMGGDHRITFGSWRARVKTEPVPSIAAELEMATATLHPPRGTRTLRARLLEVDKFPLSTLEATMKKTGERRGEHLVEGVTELHGVRKRLRFTGLLTQDGDTFHFVASFVISRKTFGIRYAPAEPFLKDDVRVVLDVVAVPASKPPPPPPEPAPEEDAPDDAAR
ncbi:MAG: YceI family protein [Labilithrix sp.]|nr:YceI family protein [Labilithrix sp.]MCW5817850.1 YceI family protein [Labilithrix sp.]